MNPLPIIFKPILWAYDFEKCDYGTLEHWRWVRNFYGDEKIRKVLENTPATEVKPKTRPLIEAIFNFSKWNYAPL